MENILIKPPANSGYLYFNYKGSFSIVLLVLVDADYKFLYVDVGCNCRISDGGVFKNLLYIEHWKIIASISKVLGPAPFEVQMK